MVDALRSTQDWATWRSCCPIHMWFALQHAPGTVVTPLVRLAATYGTATDGISYFETPTQPELLEIVTKLRSGLVAGLKHHPFDSLKSTVPPQWSQVDPRPRLLPRWFHPTWVQHLHPDIRVAGTLSFCYQDVYVTLDPWAIDACLHSAPPTVQLPAWLERHLCISDLGYISRGDVSIADPLSHLGVTWTEDLAQPLEWLRSRRLQGDTLWHQLSHCRAIRYLTAHNRVDDVISDVDLDVLSFLVSKNPLIRLWSGDLSHSLQPWLRLHRLSFLQWHQTSDRKSVV